MEPTLVMLASPLLGPSVWEPVVTEMSRSGWSAMTAPSPPSPPRTPDDVLEQFSSAVPPDRAVVLIPHSNAGLFVPSLVRRRHVVGAIFVDAGLPPAEGEVTLAPPELLGVLAEKADGDGMLPPWTRWWDEDDVATLFPDVATRRRVEREQPRLPLTYFYATMPLPPGWDAGLAGAYLAFGDAYANQREQAAQRGWPTVTVPAGHLDMLVDPASVATELRRLLACIGFAG